MIHGNSRAPVYVKRIYLKIWSLRDEVEAILMKHAELAGRPLNEQEITQVKNEYSYANRAQTPGAGLTLVQGGASQTATPDSGDEEDLEAAMAAAMGGDGSAEEGSGEEEDLEAAMAAAMGGGDESAGEEDLEAAMAAAMGEAPAPSTPAGKKVIIQRYSENLPVEKISHGMTFLAEVTMGEVYFFTNKHFLEGQSIVLEFQIPKKFVINAEIKYCRPFNIRSRIISENKLTYRAVANFTFLKEGEKTLLRNFICSIEPDIPEEPVIEKKKVVEDEGDDFDDLDGLDF